MRSRFPALVLAAVATATVPATVLFAQSAGGGRAFTPADWFRLTTVSSPAMSPDGRYVAFEVTTVDEDANRRHSEVWMVPAAGGEPVRMTAPGAESSNPRWSPDGTYLFFTSRREGGSGSTWALRMDGEPSGEAFQLEDWPTGSVPADGSFAVFTRAAGGDDEDAGGGEEGGEPRRDDPFARMPAMARPPLGSITEPEDPRRFDGRHIVDFPYKRNGQGFVPNRREPREWRASQI
ncbi:MAG TPA: hypothetical protein VE173_02610, partial [Longimicrobiales bacterium]|nr:hypothetical protein [Longimicrobiales bacterium]